MSYLYKRHERGEDNVTMDDIPKDRKDYRYAHNERDAYAEEECYLPEELANKQYYFP